jgi:hypothetical protein
MYNPLRNTVFDGENVLIGNMQWKVVMTTTGYCLRNGDCILISGLRDQGELCDFLNKNNAERID